MINPFSEIQWKPGTAEKRTFARSLAIGLPVVAAVLGGSGWIKTGAWPSWTLWLAGVGGAAGVFLWLVPQIAGPFYALWFGLAAAMGFVISNTAVTVIYFGVITPVGLLLRLSGRDPMERRFESGQESYWKDAEKVEDAERYFRQY